MKITPIAAFHSVNKQFPLGIFGRRHTQALTNVTFHIHQGEILGVMGPNRAGKTTLVRLVLSLLPPTTGTIERFGADAKDHGTLARVGFAHGNQGFPSYMTARELLTFYGILSGLPQKELASSVNSVLEKVGLMDCPNDKLGTYSKGMNARLGLAQAILNDPDLLILDEPGEGLDIEGQQLLRDIMNERRQRGKAVLFISHSPAEIEELCDRILLLNRGQVAFNGSLDELMHHRVNGVCLTLQQVLCHFFKYPL